MLKHSCMQRAKIHLERQEQDIVIQCPDIYLRKAIINSQDGQKSNILAKGYTYTVERRQAESAKNDLEA
jgi:hypothetical protein